MVLTSNSTALSINECLLGFVIGNGVRKIQLSSEYEPNIRPTIYNKLSLAQMPEEMQT